MRLMRSERELFAWVSKLPKMALLTLFMQNCLDIWKGQGDEGVKWRNFRNFLSCVDGDILQRVASANLSKCWKILSAWYRVSHSKFLYFYILSNSLWMKFLTHCTLNLQNRLKNYYGTPCKSNFIVEIFIKISFHGKLYFCVWSAIIGCIFSFQVECQNKLK